MSRFCRNHCHERSVEELEERLAALNNKTDLTPLLEKEKRRVEDTLSFKKASETGGDA